MEDKIALWQTGVGKLGRLDIGDQGMRNRATQMLIREQTLVEKTSLSVLWFGHAHELDLMGTAVPGPREQQRACLEHLPELDNLGIMFPWDLAHVRFQSALNAIEIRGSVEVTG